MSYFKVVCPGCGAVYRQGLVGHTPVGTWGHKCPTAEQEVKRNQAIQLGPAPPDALPEQGEEADTIPGRVRKMNAAADSARQRGEAAARHLRAARRARSAPDE